MEEKEFYSKIVGSTFCDGQELIKGLSPEDILKLVPEPDNKFDAHAVAVFTLKEERLGYIPKDTAKDLSPKLLSGSVAIATVSEVTGGTTDKSNVGCNIKIKLLDDTQ